MVIHRRESCIVTEGGECVEPHRRKNVYMDWGINVPTILAFLTMISAGVGFLLVNERRMTENAESRKLLESADRNIIEHAKIVEETAVRDRQEMRSDIKDIKETVNNIALVQRRRP